MRHSVERKMREMSGVKMERNLWTHFHGMQSAINLIPKAMKIRLGACVVRYLKERERGAKGRGAKDE